MTSTPTAPLHFTSSDEYIGQYIAKLQAESGNIHAEQAFLGTLMSNNKVYDQVSHFLKPECFNDPVNERIYEAIVSCIEAGRVADAVTLKNHFEANGTLAEVGGTAYLAKLLTAMVSVVGARSYAKAIHEGWLRRQAIGLVYATLRDLAQPAVAEGPVGTFHRLLSGLDGLILDGAGGVDGASFGTAAQRALARAELIYKTGGVPGLSSSIPSLDRAIMGFEPEKVYYLGGRPGMGKTALALTIARAILGQIDPQTNQPRGVGMFSLEMSAEQLAFRMMTQETGITFEQFSNAKPHDTDIWRSAGEWEKAQARRPMWIEERAGIGLGELMSRARAIRRRQRLDLLIIDHLQLIRPPKEARGNPVYGLELITGGLKALAKELKVPVLVLSQLSRKVEERDDKRPTLADLRMSGSIEQDADVVMFLYREAYYMRKEPPVKREGEKHEDFISRENKYDADLERMEKFAELIVAKNRDGQEAKITLAYDGARFSFAENYAPTNNWPGIAA